MTPSQAMRLLEVESTSDADALRQAYRDMVRVWHPDRFEGDARLRRKAAWKLGEINAAYRLLAASGPQTGTMGTSVAPTAAGQSAARTKWPARPVRVQSITKKNHTGVTVRFAAAATAMVATVVGIVTWRGLRRSRQTR